MKKSLPLIALLCSLPVFGQPNIVFIMADDLGFGNLSCYGATKITTPNCDRLAAEGMRFTRVHTPSAVCSPTRYGVLTGTYPWRGDRAPRHLIASEPLIIEDGEHTVASLLQKQGYATAAVGKWHLGVQRRYPIDWNQPLSPGPNDVGFDYYFGMITSHNQPPFVWTENNRILGKGPGDIITVEGNTETANPLPRRDDTAIAERCAEAAVRFIERNKERPFFLYYPTGAVHTPHAPAPFVTGKSQAGRFGDYVLDFDWQVGRILDALDKHNLSGNTLVIVTADNGSIASWGRKQGHNPNGHLRDQKATIFEGGHRVPFIARWPERISADSTCDEPINLVDLAATAAAIVGFDLPEDAALDSHNILPLLLGETRKSPFRPALITISKFDDHRAVIHGPWKLIVPHEPSGDHRYAPYQRNRFGPHETQLYHLLDDPTELSNVADQHPQVVERLKNTLQRYEERGRSR
ncbi:MAG: sulfatase family protein [Planctomycetota bacterium]|jgi:arylsulfatase A-like enzyme